MRIVAIAALLLELSPVRFAAAQSVRGGVSRVSLEPTLGRSALPLSNALSSPQAPMTLGMPGPSLLEVKEIGVAETVVEAQVPEASDLQVLAAAAERIQADAAQSRPADPRFQETFDGLKAHAAGPALEVSAQAQFEALSASLRRYLEARRYGVALKALEFARAYHTGKRKDGVTSEFQHQVEIALYLTTLKDAADEEKLIAAAMLHDVMEDYGVARAEIEAGFGKELADSVWLLTKEHRGVKKEPEAYFSALAKDPAASLVKGGDRIHNVQSMTGVFSLQKQKEYIAETERHILPMIARAKAHFPEQASAYRAVEQRLTSQLKLYKAMHEAVESAAPQAKREPPPSPAGVKAMIPHLVTGLNLISGVGAILVASQGLFLAASGLIVLALIFDMLDGRVARALRVSGPFGLHADSLADVVSFGVAPAILIFKSSLFTLGGLGFVPAALFAFCGLYRLARFNVGAVAEQADPAKAKHSDNFTGLPIPGGAGVIIALVLASPFVPAAWLIPASIVTTLVAAAAMVSTLPYPAYKKNLKKAIPLAAIAGAASLGLAAAGLFSLIPAAIFAIYLATGPLKAIYEGGDEGFAFEVGRKAFHQSTLLFAALYALAGFPLSGYLALGWTAAFGVLEALRLKTSWGRAFAKKWLGGITREKEANRFTGAFYDSLGVTIAILAFGSQPAVAIASILYLAFGDAASALVGRRWGRHKYQVRGETRSVEGTAAGFAVALAIGLACGFAPWIALAAALVFSLVDTVPVKPDDNLYIPILTGAVLFLLSR